MNDPGFVMGMKRRDETLHFVHADIGGDDRDAVINKKIEMLVRVQRVALGGKSRRRDPL